MPLFLTMKREPIWSGIERASSPSFPLKVGPLLMVVQEDILRLQIFRDLSQSARVSQVSDREHGGRKTHHHPCR